MRLIFGREQGWISPVIGWIERELREICRLWIPRSSRGMTVGVSGEIRERVDAA